MEGVTGISMQPTPGPDDPVLEVRMAQTMVAAAKSAGVTNFVHTSVACADEHERFAGWANGRWWPLYWKSKAAANNSVRTAGFDNWAILKPAYMMENYIQPRAAGARGYGIPLLPSREFAERNRARFVIA